ncbi:MAG: DUF2934 domain-containing protein [Thermodesulfovibrio sp.]|nr:DUF2934 domain-containing protein [Thermodesulfovibrio sp.]MDW7998922.1 DUF2934 domain-containing protein [Thermodesulfovibrio sp.]
MVSREKIEDEIRQVAYEIYLKSGCLPGRDIDNWLEAERIVLARYNMLEKVEYCEPKTEEEPKKKRVSKKTSKGKTKSKTKKS